MAKKAAKKAAPKKAAAPKKTTAPKKATAKKAPAKKSLAPEEEVSTETNVSAEKKFIPKAKRKKPAFASEKPQQSGPVTLHPGGKVLSHTQRKRHRKLKR